MTVTIKRILGAALFYLFRVFPVDSRKIVISSFAGQGYGGEGRLVAEELLKLGGDFRMIWLCREENAPFPAGIHPVKDRTLASIYHQVTGKLWIDNRRKPGYVRKRKGQYYIQLWHSGISIKCVEGDAAEELPGEYIYNAKNDSKMIDLFVSASEWRTRRIREAFWYDGEILKCDFYKAADLMDLSREKKMAIRGALGVREKVNLVLYAPTFRKNLSMEPYDLDYEGLRQALTRRFGGEWAVVIRLHPGMLKNDHRIAYSDHLIDGTRYPSIEELAAVSRFLITDYSGTMFHGYRFGCGVIRYASDLEDYLAHERKLYFRIQTMPGGLAQTNQELERIIETWDQEAYEAERKKLVDSIGFYTDRRIDLLTGRILSVLNGAC